MNNLVEIKEDAVKRAYARWAPIYDLTFGKIAEAGRMRAVEEINQLSGKVLEVGVGTGISLPHYQDHLTVTGIDLSPEMLAKARNRVERGGLDNVDDILEMDAGHMAFGDASFDVVAAMYVLTVVPDPVKVMSELDRVCKPGGEIVVVNHFSEDKGLRGTLEKRMSPFAEDLGWRPEFPIETLMVREQLELVAVERLKPFGLFTMLRFKKREAATISQPALARA